MEINLPAETFFFKPYSWELIDFKASREWFGGIWWHSFPISIAYIIAIHYIRATMQTKPPMKLKGLLFCWNSGLALFSWVVFFRCVPEILAFAGRPDGVYASICTRKHQTVGTAFYALLFAFSKVVELGDTIFVVLRKQPLIFLHWYHHTTVLLFTYFVYTEMDTTFRHMMVMNSFIHGIMYSYYALKALGFRIPKWFSMVLTSLQTLQMVLGLYVNVYTMIMKMNGVPCKRRNIDVFWAGAMYFSYFILFSNFFYKSYINKPTKKRE